MPSAKLKKLITDAFAKRTQLREQARNEGTECSRLFDGIGDGYKGLTVDEFGPILVARNHFSDVSERISKEGSASLVTALSEYPRILGEDKTLYLWSEYLGDNKKNSVQRIYGRELEQATVSLQGGRFLIKPTVTPSAGLFLDSKVVREWLHKNSKGKRVLNTFCFTGSLGIAALLGGAREVVQVDIQKSILSWSKENVKLSGVDGRVRFICEDTLRFMEKELRRVARGREKFDIIVIDPPTFSSSGGVRFRLIDALPALYESSAELIRPGGHLLCMSNTLGLNHKGLRAISTSYPLLIFEDFLLPHAPEFPASAEESGNMRGVLFKVRGTME